MLSPMTTVFVLAVLWLIVVVPMILRRNDARRRERSVDGFGQAMRALARGSTRACAAGRRTEVFVPRERRGVPLPTPTRRPMPVAQEALMYPLDRPEMSAARTRMMTRRRRSLGVLVVGAVISGPVALTRGGATWGLAALFVLGLIGYLCFLRARATRERQRRTTGQRRGANRRGGRYDGTSDVARFEETPESVVRIDDDDIALHNLDTVDLTGLYNEEASRAAAQRRAS